MVSDADFEDYQRYLTHEYNSQAHGRRTRSLVGVAVREIHRLAGNQNLSGHYKDFFFAAYDFLSQHADLAAALRDVDLAHAEIEELDELFDTVQRKWHTWIASYAPSSDVTSANLVRRKLSPSWSGEQQGGGGGSGNLKRSLVLVAHFLASNRPHRPPLPETFQRVQLEMEGPDSEPRTVRPATRKADIEKAIAGLRAKISAVENRLNTRFKIPGDEQRLVEWKRELEAAQKELASR